MFDDGVLNDADMRNAMVMKNKPFKPGSGSNRIHGVG